MIEWIIIIRKHPQIPQFDENIAYSCSINTGLNFLDKSRKFGNAFQLEPLIAILICLSTLQCFAHDTRLDILIYVEF